MVSLVSLRSFADKSRRNKCILIHFKSIPVHIKSIFSRLKGTTDYARRFDAVFPHTRTAVARRRSFTSIGPYLRQVGLIFTFDIQTFGMESRSSSATSVGEDLMTSYFTRLFSQDSHGRFILSCTRPTTTTTEMIIKRATYRLFLRGFLLFVVGMFFALVLNLLQVQRQVTLFPDVVDNVFSSAWWVPPSCGTAAAIIGLLYPYFDRQLGESQCYKQEWSSVMRCIAVFVGINHASAKIDFANNLQLSLTLTAMSLGLWWLFDRSRSGFGLGVSIAVLATLVSQLLVYNGIYRYTAPDFLYVRSSLPCIFFSGGITMGNIGRQLAISDYLDTVPHSASKEHEE